MKHVFLLLVSLFVTINCSSIVNAANNKNNTVSVTTYNITGNRVYGASGKWFVTFEYNIEWPDETKGVDIFKLKKFVMDVLFESSTDNENKMLQLQDAINLTGDFYASQFDAQLNTNVTIQQVNQMHSNSECKEKKFVTVEIYGEIEEYDIKNKILAVRYNKYLSSDNGKKVTRNVKYGTVYYDCSRNCAVTVDDLITNKDVVLDYIKKFAKNVKDNLCIAPKKVNALTDLPSNFKLKNNSITFIFDVSKIACEKAGNVEIPVPHSVLNGNLTVLGKRLLK